MPIDTEQRLRSAGLRVTQPRLAVMDALIQHHGHHDVETVAALTRKHAGAISTQAIYNVLAALDAAGLVRRIQPAGSPARFESRVGDNHHHLVCRVCNTVVDVDCAVGIAPCLQPSNAAGFKVDEAEVTFWGTCSNCQKNT